MAEPIPSEEKLGIPSISSSPPQRAEHQHEYDLRCKHCGQPGTIRISIDPMPDYPDHADMSVDERDNYTSMTGTEAQSLARAMTDPKEEHGTS